MDIKSVVYGMGRGVLVLLLSWVAPFSPGTDVGQAQITLDGSLGGAARPVESFGGFYFIDEAMGQTREANLFHSFGAFNVGTGELAFFDGTPSIRNIIGRVTGGNPSHIDGTLTSGIPDVNLFLLNPDGVMFGSNAVIDIAGSFHVSTADMLRFKNGEAFHADPSENRISTLTMASPAAFGFLNANPAPIQIEGLVGGDASLTVIGGDLQLGKLVTSGPINLISVDAPGEVALGGPAPELAFDVDHFARLGDISTIADSTVNIQGSRVLMRGGRLELVGGSMQARPDDTGLGIGLQARGEIVMDNVSIRTTPARGERAGDIEIKAGSLTLSGRDALISSGSLDQGGAGQSGDIQIEVETLALTAGGRISASTNANTDAGAVTITADVVRIAGVFGDKPSGIFSVSSGGQGQGGNIALNVGSLIVEDGGVISTSTMGPGRGGEVSIRADAVRVAGEASSILSISNAAGQGGDIDMRVATLGVENQGLISASTAGTGDAGNINIVGRGELTNAQLVRLDNSKMIANTRDEDGGDITIQSQSVVMAHSDMTADAIQGRGGFIQITSDVFLADPDSSVTAKSDDVRNNGAVDIRAPVTDLSGIVTPLSSNFHQLVTLLNHRCAIQRRERSQSRFVRRGRDRAPFAPDRVLPAATLRESERIAATASQTLPETASASSQGNGYLSCDKK